MEYYERDRDFEEELEKHESDKYEAAANLRFEQDIEDEFGQGVEQTDDHGAEPSEDVEEFARSAEFGRWIHQGYGEEAEARFDDAVIEDMVNVERDGYVSEGRIDLRVDDKYLFDYKTHDMREWTDTQATRYGDEHGKQMRSYVESWDTPDDAHGWLVSTVPPNSEFVREAYSSAAGKHNVDVIFGKSEQPEDVIDAIENTIDQMEELDIDEEDDTKR